MKFSWNRAALIFGAVILGLTVMDAWTRVPDATTGGNGAGQDSLIAAEGVAALFLLGLVAGLVLGIGLFFLYLLAREKEYAEKPDELETLLNEISKADLDQTQIAGNSFSDDEEHAETLDPWERPADWWKSVDED